jgi:hypothetical protein
MSWFRKEKQKKQYDETQQHFWDSGTNICDPKKKVYKKHWKYYKNEKGSSWLPECEPSKNVFDRCKYFDKSYASKDHPGLIQNQGTGVHALTYGLPNKIDPKTGEPNSKKYPASKEFDELQKSGKLDTENVLPWKELLPLCKEETCDTPRHIIHELPRVYDIKAFLNKCKEKDPTMVPYWNSGTSVGNESSYFDEEYKRKQDYLIKLADSKRSKPWWQGGKVNSKTKKSRMKNHNKTRQLRKKKTKYTKHKKRHSKKSIKKSKMKSIKKSIKKSKMKNKSK